MTTQWIEVAERLPEERDKPYQVLAVCVKKYEDNSNYPGQGIKRVAQDWNVRSWPQHYVRWMHIPEDPVAPPLDAPATK